MIKILRQSIQMLLFVCILSGCTSTSNQATTTDQKASLDSQIQQRIESTYDQAQTTAVFSYMQNNSIRKYWNMWVEEELGIVDPEWKYSSFSELQIIDETGRDLYGGDALYACTFSDGVGRFGYLAVTYEETGPAISKVSIEETTPIEYDFKNDQDQIIKELKKQSMDFATLTAVNTHIYDSNKKQTLHGIQFTDAQEHTCFYSYDEQSFIEIQ